MKRVVLFKCKADAATMDFIQALKNLKTLNERVTEMDSWWLEMSVGRDGLWDACLIADFSDAAALQRYENHPAHVAAGEAVAAVSEFAVFDTEN